MDIMSFEKRSKVMAKIRSKNTKPELKVRSMLHAMGFRFRLNRVDLPGKPDIVLPKYKTVIFVHGCFWHRHENCKYRTVPKTNEEFWQSKFIANINRDKKVKRQLQELNWTVLVVWECETENPEVLYFKLYENLTS